jgi:hypothetical protein
MTDLLSLLDDLKGQIFMLLPCKYIIALSVTCKSLYQFINDNDLIKKRKYLGFPRQSGRCGFYDISKIVISSTTLYDYDCDDFGEILNDKSNEIHNPLMTYILDKLLESNVDLVRGDIICDGSSSDKFRNDGVCIFNGYKLVTLYQDIDDYGSLPLEFTIINNNVPTKYWRQSFDENGEVVIGGIDHNTFYPFDITDDIFDELINNIKDDGYTYFGTFCTLSNTANKNDIIYTYFTLNNKRYYIISAWDDVDLDRITVFKDILSNNKKIILDFDDMNDIFDWNFKMSDNILFLTVSINEDCDFENV